MRGVDRALGMNSVVCAGLKRNILSMQGFGAKEISILFIITIITEIDKMIVEVHNSVASFKARKQVNNIFVVQNRTSVTLQWYHRTRGAMQGSLGVLIY